MKTRMTKIFLGLLIVLPLFDILNGILIRNFNITGVGSFFHLFFVLMLVLLTFIQCGIRIGKYEKYTIVLIGVLVISALFNSFFVDNFQSMSLDRVEKIISNAITFACLLRLCKKGVISGSSLNRILFYYAVIISVLSLFANVTRLGNHTYVQAQLGMTGFFTGSNEPIAIFTVLNVYLVYMFYKEKKSSYFVLSTINIVNLFYTQSKSAYLFAALFSILMGYILLKNVIRNGKSSKKYFIIASVVIVIFIVLMTRLTGEYLSQFIARQVFIRENAFNDSSFLNYVFSGRLERPELVTPIFERGALVSIFQMLFGQGLNFGYYEIFEIDVLDVFLYGGIIAMVTVILFMLSILKDVWSATKSKLAIVLVLLVFFYSSTAGHLWIGGIAWTYFALVCTLLIVSRNTDYEPGEVTKRE